MQGAPRAARPSGSRCSCGGELDLVERRHGDVDVPLLDQLRHLAVEDDLQDQRANVRGTVDVGVGHDDDAVVAPSFERSNSSPKTRADRGDHRLDLVVREHLVDAVLLGVDDLPAQRQDRLVRPVAAHLRGAAGGVALDDEELGAAGSRIEQSASLPGSDIALSALLRARDFARLRAACARGPRRLVDDRRASGVLLEELCELRFTVCSTRPRTHGLPSFVFVCPSNCGSRSLTEMTAASPSRRPRRRGCPPSPSGAPSARVLVQRARQRRLEAREVRAALVRC